jgi:hypothetical protein
MMSDSFLSDAGWLFFAGWSLMVTALSIAAFGRDLFPSKSLVETTPKPQPTEPTSTVIR